MDQTQQKEALVVLSFAFPADGNVDDVISRANDLIEAGTDHGARLISGETDYDGRIMFRWGTQGDPYATSAPSGDVLDELKSVLAGAADTTE